MDELDLVGLDEDGEHVVLSTPDGEHLRLRIDEALRAAVRRDRPQLEHLRAHGRGSLPPREIQAQIRAGVTADELVESAGLTLDQVRRFEGPVIAERAFVAEQAQATRVGRDPGAPVLGDLVTDRLAARGVEASSIAWDAVRTGTAPWTVSVRFTVSDHVREARWTFDAQARALHALEDEARWLSETELHDEPIPRRHLAAVREVRDLLYDIEADGGVHPHGTPAGPATPGDATDVSEPLTADAQTSAAEQDDAEATNALLDGLLQQRGVRQRVADDLDDGDGLDDGESFEGFGPQHAFDFSRAGSDGPGRPDEPATRRPAEARAGYDTPALPGLEDLGEPPAAHPPQSRPDEARDASVIALPEPVRSTDDAGDETTPAPAAGRSRARKGRASVPSWDEIVFGAKPE